MKYCQVKENPLPDYMINIVEAGIGNSFTNKAILTGNMAHFNSLKQGLRTILYACLTTQ
ncbi:MAG: hypothetical protein R2764_16345 [Bacteroidales bacterium]